jgi:hypothetical protein
MAEKCSILSSVVHIVYSSFVFIYCCTLIYYLYAILLYEVSTDDCWLPNYKGEIIDIVRALVDVLLLNV